jgi:hypothetical protein
MLGDAMPPALSGAHIGMTTPLSPAAREMARQLLARETTVATEAAGPGATMQRASTRVADNLRRSVGEDGYRALLGRALARTQSDHPILKDLRHADDDGIYLDVIGGVDTHGVAAVGAALESVLAALVDMLSDLIGADMVRNLLDQDDLRGARRNGRTP